MQRILSLVFISIITIALVIALVYFIGVKGFTFAWGLNFLLMGCVLAFTETLKSNHTSSYYQDKKWEKRGKIYESFGINIYRKLLVWTGWEKLNKKANPVGKKTEILRHLYLGTKKSELGHLIIFIIVLGFNIYVAITFGFVKSLWLLALNILLNVYPILLQRYNLPRIERALAISNRNNHK